jgi:RNA recognition motif-containing protein
LRLIVPQNLAESCFSASIRLPSNSQEMHMKKIFVGNLDFGATEDTIRSLFEAHGAVESVKLMTDRDTGRSRGFAFVEMADAEAEAAINALNGTNLGGRALNVNEARPKVDRAGGGGGGHGDGGRSRRGGPRW